MTNDTVTGSSATDNAATSIPAAQVAQAAGAKNEASIAPRATHESLLAKIEGDLKSYAAMIGKPFEEIVAFVKHHL